MAWHRSWVIEGETRAMFCGNSLQAPQACQRIIIIEHQWREGLRCSLFHNNVELSAFSSKCLKWKRFPYIRVETCCPLSLSVCLSPPPVQNIYAWCQYLEWQRYHSFRICVQCQSRYQKYFLFVDQLVLWLDVLDLLRMNVEVFQRLIKLPEKPLWGYSRGDFSKETKVKAQTLDRHAGRNLCNIEEGVYIWRELHAFFVCVGVCLKGIQEFYAYSAWDLGMQNTEGLGSRCFQMIWSPW